MTKKYLLCPGYVVSVNDGDRHYIGAARLADLWGVRMADCVVQGRGVSERNLIPLYPRESGNYTLPERYR